MTGTGQLEKTSSRRLSAPATLTIGALLNALLGVVGYVPYIFSVHLASGITGALGWTRPTQTFRDGYVHVFLFVFALWAVYVPIVIFCNRALLGRSSIRPRWYWAVCLPLLLMPSGLAAIEYGFLTA